jgi:hypothetical protein
MKTKKADETRIGKDEMNLIEHPFSLLTDRRDPNQKAIMCQIPMRGKGGELVAATWEVTGSEKYGLPYAADEDVVLVLLELTKEQGFQSRTIQFSRYELIRRIKGDVLPSGRDYRRIEDALARLNGVSIKTNHFWDNRAKKYATLGFHILEDFALYEEPSGNKAKRGQLPIRHSYITWDKHLFQSFTDGYIKSLDLDRYFALSSSIARRLYRLLDKRFYDGKPQFEINLRQLAHEHIGLARSYKYESQVKQAMDRAHDELIAAGFVGGVEYRDTPDGLNVIYFNTNRVPRTLPAATDDSPPLVKSLIEYGISHKTAKELLSAFGEDRIREQIGYFPYRNSKSNPSGLLITSIREDYPEPAGYTKAQKAKNRLAQRRRIKGPSEDPDIERRSRIEATLADLTEGALEILQRRAEQVAREKHSQAAKTADRGKGLKVWKTLVNAELERLLLDEDEQGQSL